MSLRSLTLDCACRAANDAPQVGSLLVGASLLVGVALWRKTASELDSRQRETWPHKKKKKSAICGRSEPRLELPPSSKQFTSLGPHLSATGLEQL